MARKNYKPDRLPPFVPILIEEIESQAYISLTGNASKAYTLFKKVNGLLKKKQGDEYSGIFGLTYSEAERYGFARKTFSRAVTELNDKGFINIVEQGGLRGCKRTTSKYELSNRWRDWGKIVKSWENGKVVERTAFINRPRHPTEPHEDTKRANQRSPP